jgi:hypothetical protein
MTEKLAAAIDALTQATNPFTLGSVAEARLRESGAAFWKLHQRLEAVDPATAAPVLRPIGDRRQRPLLLVIVSSYFDPVGPDAASADPLNESQTTAERDRREVDRVLGEVEAVVIAYPDDYPAHAPLSGLTARWGQHALETVKPGTVLIWAEGETVLHERKG